MRAKSVELIGVRKSFGEVLAVRALDLLVEPGEFLTLLGPSGCGKTTLLRLIAGLEAVSAGAILVGGQEVTGLPPHRRDTSIMFQDYALFPHKTLSENVGYGLKMRGIPKEKRDQAAQDWLERIGLSEMGGRLPHQLSGGQRQRVALARALIINPGVLLLDEPLGALDANLRKQLQGELRRLHKEVGLTFIYVTHDQEEAITMSDRIAVMNQGAIEQLASPQVVYDSPETAFVAGFIGHCNMLEARISEIEDDSALCDLGALGCHRVPASQEMTVGSRQALALRPEAIRLLGDAQRHDDRAVELAILDVRFTGSNFVLNLQARDRQRVDVEVSRKDLPNGPPSPGQSVFISWPHDALRVLR